MFDLKMQILNKFKTLEELNESTKAWTLFEMKLKEEYLNKPIFIC